MASREPYDWIDDPFDDAKNAEDLESARRSRNLGCVICGVIAVVAILVGGGIATFLSMASLV